MSNRPLFSEALLKFPKLTEEEYNAFVSYLCEPVRAIELQTLAAVSRKSVKSSIRNKPYYRQGERY